RARPLVGPVRHERRSLRTLGSAGCPLEPGLAHLPLSQLAAKPVRSDELRTATGRRLHRSLHDAAQTVAGLVPPSATARVLRVPRTHRLGRLAATAFGRDARSAQGARAAVPPRPPLAHEPGQGALATAP